MSALTFHQAKIAALAVFQTLLQFRNVDRTEVAESIAVDVAHLFIPEHTPSARVAQLLEELDMTALATVEKRNRLSAIRLEMTEFIMTDFYAAIQAQEDAASDALDEHYFIEDDDVIGEPEIFACEKTGLPTFSNRDLSAWAEEDEYEKLPHGSLVDVSHVGYVPSMPSPDQLDRLMHDDWRK